MDKEVDPQVLAVINEKRLTGEKRTPVEIITKLGVFDARQQASEYAWLATGDIVIATIWAEFVRVGEQQRWFYLESLDTQHGPGGGDKSALQIQRSKDRLKLLKRTLDAGKGFRAVLQTNRVAIAELDSNKSAKVSTRVPDDQEWHVASWEPDQLLAVLVRGERGWVPDAETIKAARAKGGIPEPQPVAKAGQLSREEVQAAAMDYLMRHFGGYGYKAEDTSAQGVGHDIAVSDKKGNALLKLAVKGTATGMTGFKLSTEERAALKREPLWRMVVVADVGTPTAQHKIYKPNEIDSAPGLEPLL